MATILVQHLMNYMNSYPITPKIYIPLSHTSRSRILPQDMVAGLQKRKCGLKYVMQTYRKMVEEFTH